MVAYKTTEWAYRREEHEKKKKSICSSAYRSIGGFLYIYKWLHQNFWVLFLMMHFFNLFANL